MTYFLVTADNPRAGKASSMAEARTKAKALRGRGAKVVRIYEAKRSGGQVALVRRA